MYVTLHGPFAADGAQAICSVDFRLTLPRSIFAVNLPDKKQGQVRQKLPFQALSRRNKPLIQSVNPITNGMRK